MALTYFSYISYISGVPLFVPNHLGSALSLQLYLWYCSGQTGPAEQIWILTIFVWTNTSNAVCEPYMFKPGQSLSEKPCEPHFGFQDQQSFSMQVDSAEADKYGFGTQKRYGYVNLKNHICSVYGSYPYLSGKMHLSRTVPFHII